MDSNSNIDDVNSLKTLKQVRKRGFVGGRSLMQFHWSEYQIALHKLTIIIIYFKCKKNTAIQKKPTSKSQKNIPFLQNKINHIKTFAT